MKTMKTKRGRNGRIMVTDGDTTIFVKAPPTASEDQDLELHTNAVRTLCRRQGWKGNLVYGHAKDYSIIWTWITHTNVVKISD